MIVINRITGKVREIKLPSYVALIRATCDGVDRCTGPCRCRIEPDGQCLKGWPSRLVAAGVM